MDIQKCSLDDVERLAVLNKQLIEDEKSDNTMTYDELAARMRGFLETDYEAYFFMDGSDVVGYALVNVTRKPLYLRQFLIVREYRRKGCGKAAFELLLKELGTDTVDLEVLSWNETGMEFWKSLGFAERSRYMRLR